MEQPFRERAIALQAVLRISLLALALAAYAILADNGHFGLLLTVTPAYLLIVTTVDVYRLRHDRVVLRTIEVVTDAVTATFVMTVMPDLQVLAIPLAVNLVAAQTAAAGWPMGAATAAGMTAALTVSAASDGFATLGGLPLTAFALAAAATVVVLHNVTFEQRMQARNLRRLHDAINSLAADPYLESTLRSISISASQALDAYAAATVLLRDDESMRIECSDEAVRRMSEPLGGGPTSAVLDQGKPISIPRLSDDARFLPWYRTVGQPHVAAMATVPVRAGGRTLGALNAYWGEAGHPSEHELSLLVVFADAAAIAVLRADAYDALWRTAEELRGARQAQVEFTASVAHDLRTPLTTIRGFIETVLSQDRRLDPTDRRGMLKVAHRNAVQLSNDIARLLEFSKLDADHVTVNPKPEALDVVLAEVIEDCAGLLVDHDLSFHVPDDVTVVVDTSALHHIVSNLLGNAVRYSPEGTTIELAAEQREADAVITMTDQGPGIDPDDLDRIFLRYYRGHGAEQQSGTGIGLSIVRNYVELSGGSVWAERPDGGGTRFAFTLPLATSTSTV